MKRLKFEAVVNEVNKSGEAIMVEDMRRGAIHLNEAARVLMVPGCGCPKPSCLLCRIYPPDAIKLANARSRLMKKGGSVSGSVRTQTSPGCVEWVGFHKVAYGHISLTRFWHEGDVNVGEMEDEKGLVDEA